MNLSEILKTIDPIERPSRGEILKRVNELVIEQTGHEPERVRPESSLVLDLGIDSLEFVELFLTIEEVFQISIPEIPPDGEPVVQEVFTRENFSVKDLSELVFMLWDTPPRPLGVSFWKGQSKAPANHLAAFTHLDGTASPGKGEAKEIYEPLAGSNSAGFRVHRRKIDGMACVEIPGSNAVRFADRSDSVESFVIDIEPVSTTAYARFLNSIGPVDSHVTEIWFDLPDWDKRRQHLPLEKTDAGWQPKPGTKTWPMVLVSWFGANAYALWANGGGWSDFRDESPFLPSVKQFEYSARGESPQLYPWGNCEPTPEQANLARFEFRRDYQLADIPLSPVHEQLGLSPFGLRHMAGNVWHWCRDWFDPETRKIRCEKGGSWIGPAELARCHRHRGRPPLAKGRCLGFRCVRPMA